MNDVKIKLAVEGAAQVVTGVDKSSAAIDKLGAAAGRVTATAAPATAAVENLRNRMDGAGTAAERLSSRIGQMGQLALVALGVGQLTQAAGGVIRLADEYANLHGRLTLVSSSGQAATATQQRLFGIAQETRSGVAGLSEIFVKLSQSTEGSGISQERLLNITRTMGQTMALSGGSVASMNAALVQLGQGMGSGVLRGEELNSVIEQMPALARAIAEGMGRTVAELKAMGEAGQITSAAIVLALEASAKKVESDFTRLPLTVGQAMTQMQNSLLQTVGVFDQGNGLSRGLAQGISTLSQNMNVLAAAGTLVASVVGGRLAQAIATSVAGMVAQRAAMLADLQATVASAEAKVAHTAAMAAESRATVLRVGMMGAAATAERAAALATATHTAALQAQVVAQAELAAARSVGVGALALMGGPLGAITLALGLGAAAWMLWGNSGADAAKKAAGAVLNAGPGVLAQLQKENEALARRIALLRGTGLSVVANSPAEELRIKLIERYNALASQQTKNENEERLRRISLIAVTLELANANKQLADAARLKNEADQVGKGKAAYDKLMAELGTPTEKLNAELAKQRGLLGDLFTPDVERRIRAHFIKPTGDAAAAAKTKTDATMAAAQAQERHLDTLGKGLENGEKDLAQLREKYIELVAGKAVMSDVTIQELEHQAVLLETQAIRALDKNLNQAEFESQQARIAQLRQEIVLRRGLAGVIAAKDAEAAADRNAKAVIAANQKAADQALADWQRMSDQIGQSLSDALMQGGKSALDYLKSLVRTMVFRPMLQFAVQPMVNSVGSFLGYGAPAGAGGGSSLGSSLGTASALGTMGAFGTFGTAFGMGSGLTAAGGLGTALGASGTMIGAGNYAAGFGMGAGALAGPAALAYVLGNALSSSYDQGFGRNQARNAGGGAFIGGGAGLYGSVSADLATGLSKLGLSDKWADILSGSTAWAATFGRSAPRVTGSGIKGSIGGGDFTGSAYADIKEKGGIFRSDKTYTRTSALPEEIGRLLDESSKDLLTRTTGYGQALGLVTDTLAGVTQDIKIKLGDDAEANKTAILESMASYGQALAAGWADALKPLAAYGETTAQTAERLAGSLTAANAIFKQLDLTLLDASVAGGAAAAALVDVFGGLDSLQAASASYYEKFYSDAERTAKLQATMTESLAGVGLAVPASIQQFRDLVEQTDRTTEAGRAQYATLMGVADAFAQIADSGKDLVAAGQGVAAYIAELRGAASGGGTLASARAAYEADLAAARGGDVAATGRIVGDAKTLVDAVRAAASDPVALARETARIAAQLQALPATRAWEGQLPVLPAEPGAPAGTVGGTAGGTAAVDATNSMAGELRALRLEVEKLRADNSAENVAIAAHVGKTARILERVTPDGDAMATRAAE